MAGRREGAPMRMAELSRRSGVPIPTIRFYIREGLLPPGRATSTNQAQYDDGHVRTLKLARTLVEVGGLSLQRARHVLELIRSEDADPYRVMGAVQYALTEVVGPASPGEVHAQELVDTVIRDRGWAVREDNPARTSLARALSTLARLEQQDVIDSLDAYADAADALARREVAELVRGRSVDDLARGVIAFDILGDAVLSALRRLAQEAEVTRRLGPVEAPDR